MADQPPPINSLECLGFSEHFASQLDSRAQAEGWRPGRVVAQHRGEWDVLTEAGPARAVLAGRHYGSAERPDRTRFLVQPTVGDWVLLSEPPTGQLHVMERVLARRTWLERSAAGRRRESQIIVANVDLVVVVCALSHPSAQDTAARRSTHPRRIERYLAAVSQGKSEALVALNKADLCPEGEAVAARLRERLPSYDVITTSATAPGGLAELRAKLLPRMTVGFVGLSGVGKSSLVNAVLGRSIQRTGADLLGSAKGKHTTTHRELFATEQGVLLVDTPGMREFALSADAEDVGGFEDVMDVAAHCRFRDCRHRGEPDCAVSSAITSGQLDPQRVKSYLDLCKEMAQRSSSIRARERGASKTTSTTKGRPKPRSRLGGGHAD